MVETRWFYNKRKCLTKTHALAVFEISPTHRTINLAIFRNADKHSWFVKLATVTRVCTGVEAAF